MNTSYHSHASSIGSSRSGSGTTMPDSNTSLTSSIQMRGENSTCSSTSYVNELSLPSSFASSSANSSRRDGGGGGGGGIVRLGPTNDGVQSGIYQPSRGDGSSMADSFDNMSLHSQQQQQQQRGNNRNNNRNNNDYRGSSNRSVNSNYSSNRSMNRSSQQQQQEFGGSRHSNNNSGALEIYNADGILSTQDEEQEQGNEIISTNNNDDNSSLTSTDALALRISKETKPMHHLLRLLKDMEPTTGNTTVVGHHVDAKDRARASLISDFEQEVQVIEHRMKDENMILNGEQPPLPPNWIALEDPDSGDVYYANEATGETQWERPGLITELKERIQDMNNSQELSLHNQSYTSKSCSNNNNLLQNNNSQMSNNNYETRGSGTTASTSEEGMGGSSSDNYDYSEQKQSQNQNNMSSSNSNNYNHNNNNNLNNSQQEGMHNSQMSNNYRDGNNMDNGNNNNASNNNFEESKNSTLQSSLTDSNHGAASGLPPDWIALEDPDTGEMYYANEVTGESTWDRPISSMPIINNNKSQQQSMPQSMPENDLNRSGNSNSIDHRSQQPLQEEEGVEEEEEETLDDDNDNNDDLPPDWIALEDADSGDTYYLNQNTMETTWDRPSTEDEQQNHHHPADDDNNPQTNTTNSNLDEQSLDHITMGSGGEPVSNHGDLPPGWEAVLDETSGDYYYAHESSGETTWDRPTFQQSSSSVGNQIPADAVEEEEEEQDDTDNHDDSLPPGWFGAVDEDSGDQYYCNEVTGETTWDFPTGPAIPDTEPVESPVEVDGDDDDDDLPQGWFEVTDPSSGDLYYCNEASGETSWDRPTGRGGGVSDQNLMSRLSLNDTTVYEDDSVTSSQY